MVIFKFILRLFFILIDFFLFLGNHVQCSWGKNNFLSHKDLIKFTKDNSIEVQVYLTIFEVIKTKEY